MIGLDLGRLDSNLHLTKDIKNSVLSNNICMIIIFKDNIISVLVQIWDLLKFEN